MGFECRIFISAEQFAMYRSNTSPRGSAAGGDSTPDPTRSLSPSTVSRGAAAAELRFGDNSVHVFDPSEALSDEGRASPLVDPVSVDNDLPSIIPVDVPEGVHLSQALLHVICNVNFAIGAINGFVTQTTSLDAHQIAQALRNYVRFQSKNNGRHISQFLKRTLKKFKNLANSFNAEHPANMVTLMSLGYDEQTANQILDSLNGRSLKPIGDERAEILPRDRICWFWLFINLRMRTNFFKRADSMKAFFLHATNPSGYPLPQECQQVAIEAYNQFVSQVPEPGIHVQGLRQTNISSACSDFTTMTQIGGFLWKYHTAFTAVSKLLTEWLSGNVHLHDQRAKLSEEALIALVYRLFAKMQCSKTGDFGTDRAFSSYIYNKLMEAYWRAQKSGARFVLRLSETFSSIQCATGNYDAAIEWLNRALQCKHPKKGDLTPEEVAVLNFAFISMSLGVQSLASCTSDNLGALFAHIFDGANLEVDESEAPKFQSAIDRVAADFANEPEFEVKPVFAELQPSERRSHGGQRGGAAAGGGNSAHRVSQDARSFDLEAMMKAAAADPQKKAAMLTWLSESK
jgi:tetratricopeptide (TPR) repeat protein